MTRLHFALLSTPFVAAIVAGCAGSPGSSPPVRVSGSALRDAARTMPHFMQPLLRTDRGRSWMSPAYAIGGARKRSPLLYSGDDGTNDVYVY